MRRSGVRISSQAPILAPGQAAPTPARTLRLGAVCPYPCNLRFTSGVAGIASTKPSGPGASWCKLAVGGGPRRTHGAKPARWGVGAVVLSALVLTGCSRGTSRRGAESGGPTTSADGLRTCNPPSGRARFTFRRVDPRPRARSGRTRRDPGPAVEHSGRAGPRRADLRRGLCRPLGPRRLQHAVLLCLEQFALQVRPWRQRAGDRAVPRRRLLRPLPR